MIHGTNRPGIQHYSSAERLRYNCKYAWSGSIHIDQKHSMQGVRILFNTLESIDEELAQSIGEKIEFYWLLLTQLSLVTLMAPLFEPSNAVERKWKIPNPFPVYHTLNVIHRKGLVGSTNIYPDQTSCSYVAIISGIKHNL